MKKICIIIEMILLFILIATQRVQAEEQILERRPATVGQKFVPGEIVVKFKPGVGEDKIAKLNSKCEATCFYISRHAGFRRLRIPKRKTVSEMVELYKRDPNVEYAEPNYIAHAFWIPNDEYYRYQWHLDNQEYEGINTEEAWNIEAGNPGVLIAVVDTGVAYEDYTERVGRRTRRYYQAPDLAQTNFVPGYDFVNNDAHPNDDEGHGTHVTGTIAQSTNNSIGVAGVAFNCSIMPVKVLDKNGSGTYTDVAEGIHYAADNGAKVINLSLGGSSESITLKDAVAYAYNKGVALICASGNDGSPDTISYPAAYDEYCISVGATRYDETVAYYSNRGPSLDLVAPGGDLNVDQNRDGYGDGVLQQTFGDTTNDWGYWFYQGTSMAAPHVSGVAALLIAHSVATSPDAIREVLQSSAKDKGSPGWDTEYGYGIVDAYAALTYFPAPNNPPVANAGSDLSALAGATLTFDGSGSYDSDGTIVSYDWDFGDGSTGSGVTVSHSYSAVGTYTVSLTVTDNGSLTNTDTALVTITAEPGPISIFSDSFEVSEWNGLWTEDSQNDWFRSTQRAKDGIYSAEVDGYASNARLISMPIDLKGKTNANITFSWYIESSLDSGEYLAFDVSTNSGANWVEKARVRGNIDPENTWHNVSIDLVNISSLRVRFRGKMSASDENANVDMVQVIAW